MPLAKHNGVDTELVGPDELRKLLPKLEGDWLGGVWTESDGSADPEKATAAFAKAAERHGTQFRLFAPEVKELEMKGGRVEGVRLVTGEVVSAGTTVVAAGAWTSEL